MNLNQVLAEVAAIDADAKSRKDQLLTDAIRESGWVLDGSIAWLKTPGRVEVSLRTWGDDDDGGGWCTYLRIADGPATIVASAPTMLECLVRAIASVTLDISDQ